VTDISSDLLSACIDLALCFKCDPFTFLDLPQEQVMTLYRITASRLAQLKQE